MTAFVSELKTAFGQNRNPEVSQAMSAYMKNLFPFFGLKNENRKNLLKPIWKIHKDEIDGNFREIVCELWTLPEREFHYCAMEILGKHIAKKYRKDDIVLIEKLIASQSWWDSVDYFARHSVGNYLLAFPDETSNVVKRFSESENMWLNRTAILFQLGYKSKTDEKILFGQCAKHASSKEFFIRKAIGWALREYAKTNPEAVKKFVSQNQLSGLSEREALKNL